MDEFTFQKLDELSTANLTRVKDEAMHEGLFHFAASCLAVLALRAQADDELRLIAESFGESSRQER